MSILSLIFRGRLVFLAVISGLLLPLPLSSAEFSQPLPTVLEVGFLSWSKGGGVEAILNGWEKGGLMEGRNKAAMQARYFRNLSSTLGSYKSRDFIQSKPVSRLSQVLYVSINFQRGVVYGRFLIYKTDKDWVVQNMDFSERPEAIMPWLAVLGGESGTD